MPYRPVHLACLTVCIFKPSIFLSRTKVTSEAKECTRNKAAYTNNCGCICSQAEVFVFIVRRRKLRFVLAYLQRSRKNTPISFTILAYRSSKTAKLISVTLVGVGSFIKVCRNKPILVTIGQLQRTPCVKTRAFLRSSRT